MRAVEAVELLASTLSDKPSDPAVFRALATRLGNWPLLLRLAGSVLQARLARGEPLPKALDHVNLALDKKGITAFDRADADSRHDAVTKTVGVSLDLLVPEDRQRCFELAVFSEDVGVILGATVACARHPS